MDIVDFILGILDFINFSLIPLILALAFLFFIWNAVQYFIIQGASDEGREKSKSLALWGILGFVIIISLWGIVNIFVKGFGFNDDRAIIPDYITETADFANDFENVNSDPGRPPNFKPSNPKFNSQQTNFDQIDR